MSATHHQLPRKVFTDLAAGEGGREAVDLLAAAEHSKHMVLLFGVLDAARGTEHAASARMGYDLLAAAWRADRQAAETVIRHPSVGVWARRTVQACRGGPAIPGAEPGGLRAVGAAAAIRAGLDTEIEVPVTGGRVMLPSLGAADVPGRTVTVLTGRDHMAAGPVEIPGDPAEDAQGWLGLRRVHMGSFSALIDDLDPFRMPDVPNLAPRQSSAGEWQDMLERTWPVLERFHPVTAAEIAAGVSVIVPRSRPPTGGAVSATSPEAFGAIAMSLPPDPVASAETLTHEIQHLKLAALLDIVTLTLPDDGRRYYAPWRDDPRPLSGLLQGSYAYLGETKFWRRQSQRAGNGLRANAQYARWRAAVNETIDTLRSSGRLTPAGLDFVAEMARALNVWQADPVPAQAQEQARRAAEAHLTQWQAAHGPRAI